MLTTPLTFMILTVEGDDAYPCKGHLCYDETDPYAVTLTLLPNDDSPNMWVDWDAEIDALRFGRHSC
jgi:hypothetical protein